MLTLDSQGRPCYSGGHPSSRASIQPQRIVKEAAKPDGGKPNVISTTPKISIGGLASSSNAATPAESPRGGSATSSKSVLVPISTNSSNVSTNITNFSSGLSNPPVKLQSNSTSSFSTKLPAVDDNDLNKNKESRDSLIMIEKLKSKVKELERENEKLKSHVIQAEDCIKSYRIQSNGATPLPIRGQAKDSSSQTDHDSIENSSLNTARSSFSSASGTSDLIRLQNENTKLLSSIDSYRSENKKLNANNELKDVKISQLSSNIDELALELDKLKNSSPPSSISGDVSTQHHHISISNSNYNSNIINSSNNNNNILKSKDYKGSILECASALKQSKKELSEIKDAFLSFKSFQDNVLCEGLKKVTAFVATKATTNIGNSASNNSNNGSNNNNKKSNSTPDLNSISILESKVVALEQDVQHSKHDLEISERTVSLLATETKHLKMQEEKYLSDIDRLNELLLEKDSKINSMRQESDSRLDIEISKWKNAKAKKIEADYSHSSCDPMTPIKAPPSLIPSVEQLLTEEREISKTLASKLQEVKMRVNQASEELQKFQSFHKAEMDALKHCAHVKDLGRIAQHREVCLERDKMSSDLKHAKEIVNIITCSLNTAEQSLSETQQSMVAKLIEGRTKRIKLIEKQTQERSKDIDQRSMETCVVSSQHLEGFQKKASDKLVKAAEDSAQFFKNLQATLASMDLK